MKQWLHCNNVAAGLLFFATTALAAQPTFTILTTFSSDVSPVAPPVLGTDGNFYGITSGISPAPGMVYKVTPQGVMTTIYTFCSQPTCDD